MYLDDYVKAKRPLNYWRELLYEWVFLVHRVYRVSKGRSAVHSESERANTGILAAASIKNGWIALEESKTEKVSIKPKKETYFGRCDLILWRDQRHHKIEAKCSRFNLYGNVWERIVRAHEKSKLDTQKAIYVGYKSEKKIAITFIIPVVDKSKLDDYSDADIKEKLKTLIKYIEDELSPTVMSYAFPGPVHMEGRVRMALGVILIGDVIV